MALMQIVINGQKKDFDKALKLKKIIEQFCRNPNHVIAEVNGHIVKSQNWDQADVEDGDKIELVTFVGGG